MLWWQPVITSSYNHRHHYLTRRLVIDEAGAIKSQSANFRKMQRVDVLGSAPFTLAPFWHLQLTSNLNYTTYPIFQTTGFIAAARLAFNVQVQQQIKLPAGMQLEVASFYYSRELWGIYLADEIYYSDLGLKKSFLHNKLTAQFTFTDFFKTNVYQGKSLTNVTNDQYYDRPYSHRFGVSVQYHLGGKLVNKKGNKIEEQDRI